MSDVFYCPPDVATSRRIHATSCGHAAIAALLGLPVADVARVQPKPYTSPSAAEKALLALGARPQKLRGAAAPSAASPAPWPTERGLVIVQIDGPWTRPEVPVAAAYKHMHCVATAKNKAGWWVYDHNVYADDLARCVGDEGGGWMIGSLWKREIMDALALDTKRSNGRWWVRASWEVGQ